MDDAPTETVEGSLAMKMMSDYHGPWREARCQHVGNAQGGITIVSGKPN